MSTPIDIYTTPICPYCAMAKRLLDQKGADYREINVMGDAGARAEMVERAPGARQQPRRDLPGRDVNHVRVEDGVDRPESVGPIGSARVDPARRLDVLHAGRRDPVLDRRQALGIRVGGQPGQPGQPLREKDRVLARSAGDLEDARGRGQPARDHLEDRRAVAMGRGGVAKRSTRGGDLGLRFRHRAPRTAGRRSPGGLSPGSDRGRRRRRPRSSFPAAAAAASSPRSRPRRTGRPDRSRRRGSGT